MIKNYIKMAWRNLWKSKGYSVINIMGLAIGMTAVLVIAIWVQNQLQFDNFYSNKENLYKVWNKYEDEGEIGVYDITSAPTAPALKDEFPEVEYTARMYWLTDRLFTYADKKLKSKGNEVDASFLQMFNFPLIKGTAQHILNDPKSIVLTVSLAKSLFGNEDPMDKTITLDNKESFKVTGVMQDLPSYTDFDFSYLIPLKADMYGSNWNTNTFYTYVQLKAGTDVNAFNKKIANLVRKQTNDELKSSVFLYPIAKMHLYSQFEQGVAVGGKIEQVRLVAGIGLLILLIACINFINLSTARSQKRAKEVAVRKVVGANRSSLIGQFLTESVLLTFISGILALGLTFIVLPLFNQLLDKPLSLELTNPLIWLGMLGFILMTGLLAGLYPAFVLSSFQPIKALKTIGTRKRFTLNFREVLVVLQFGIAIVLIIATLIVRKQIDYAGLRDIGYATSRLIEIPVEGDIEKNYEVIKSELVNTGIATSVTRTGWSITRDASNSSGNFSWDGATPKQIKNLSFNLVRTESDFIKTLGLTLVDGRDLDYARLAADSAAVLLNEAAIKEMKLQNPVGKFFKRGDNTYTIVGVFKDFISGSPYSPISPMLVLPSKEWLYNIAIHTNTSMPTDQVLQKIEVIFKKFNPAYPFNYSFVDQQFAKKFKEQEQTGQLALIFSVLAIFISCLGLFGLTSYIAELRIKEIGIRKVLGASVTGITTMLSKDFVKLVVLSILIASPIAWWAMNKWLQDFSYRIEIQWWIFILAGVSALAVAITTVSMQAIKAANTNPVKTLRDE
ncbi:ABC transporter permease [Sphingobacterium sp. SRCM116780]|uniref:ABC transporter permease n=1 Tax=Sphingobacterium sp. SRCM116780 TaxID=2907623 RepID=UPI001F20CDF9|nr:ABC transporter permease [Sphingobacterium sp. SRCM116780]UIR55122.1 ABC transporter permease [Sphingobacterium sp. SRCM116780]